MARGLIGISTDLTFTECTQVAPRPFYVLSSISLYLELIMAVV